MSNNLDWGMFSFLFISVIKEIAHVILWAIDVPHSPRQREAKLRNCANLKKIG